MVPPTCETTSALKSFVAKTGHSATALHVIMPDARELREAETYDQARAPRGCLALLCGERPCTNKRRCVTVNALVSYPLWGSVCGLPTPLASVDTSSCGRDQGQFGQVCAACRTTTYRHTRRDGVPAVALASVVSDALLEARVRCMHPTRAQPSGFGSGFTVAARLRFGLVK